MSDIRDPGLWESGDRKIEWVRGFMPLLNGLESELSHKKPLDGLRVALSVHMEAKTARLCLAMQALGAEMHVSGCNPLSTQDDVAAALSRRGVDVHAWHAATAEEYERHLTAILEYGPHIIIDDGGDLVNLLHTKLQHLIPGVVGGCEETTTGVRRLYAMEKEGALRFPMITVNDARCKYLFDNRYGTGQSVWDGINRTTNLIVAGKTVVIAGYGWCGRGIAMRAKGFGARVVITEVDPVKALEAMMDGFDVMTMDEAAPLGDLFITSTGCCGVITKRHFDKMKSGAVMCNAGHFNVEVDVAELEAEAERVFPARENITGYAMKDGRTLFVLAEGRLVNLASGDGHPAEIMDMSFAIQLLCAVYTAQNRGSLPVRVMKVPEEIDREVALRKLKLSGRSVDTLTDRQREYLGSWNL